MNKPVITLDAALPALASTDTPDELVTLANQAAALQVYWYRFRYDPCGSTSRSRIRWSSPAIPALAAAAGSSRIAAAHPANVQGNSGTN